MKDYLKTLGFIFSLLGVVVLVCIIGATSKYIMYIEMFLAKHIWLAVIIAIVLLVFYIKSIIRKLRK